MEPNQAARRFGFMLLDAQIERIWAGESPIRVLREHRGLSLLDLAKRTNLSLDQLERYEKSRSIPREDRLVKIAQALGVRPSDLRRSHHSFAECARLFRAQDA